MAATFATFHLKTYCGIRRGNIAIKQGMSRGLASRADSEKAKKWALVITSGATGLGLMRVPSEPCCSETMLYDRIFSSFGCSYEASLTMCGEGSQRRGNTIVAGTMVVAVRIIGHNHGRDIFRTSSAVFQSIRHIFGLCALTQHTAGDRCALFSLYASRSQKRKKGETMALLILAKGVRVRWWTRFVRAASCDGAEMSALERRSGH